MIQCDVFAKYFGSYNEIDHAYSSVTRVPLSARFLSHDKWQKEKCCKPLFIAIKSIGASRYWGCSDPRQL